MSNAPLPPSSLPHSATSARRGVLLLIVLSMLTLFLMLGTAYLVVSTRSRETARAFAKLAMQSESTRIPPAHVLDAAFLRIVRGGANLGLPSVTPPGVAAPPTPFESLLEDKYGSSVTGTATGVSAVANAPLLRVQGLTIPGYSPGSGTAGPAGLEAVTDFPGRVITLLPAGRRPTSHRIVRADASAGLTLYVDLRSDGREFRVPSGAVPVVINGPEFQPHRTNTMGTTTNEAWDAFDSNNTFLTHLTPNDKANGSAPESVSSSVVKRVGLVGVANSGTLLSGGLLSSGSNGFSYGADNDGDGVADGMFVDIGLPSSYKDNGDVVRFDVSALVVDLDSRYNVNAHGSLVPYIYSATSSSPHAGWAAGTAQRLTWLGTSSTTTNVSAPAFLGLPVGSGYGPAEVNGRWMFPSSTYSIGPRSQSGGDPATECLFAISGASQGSLAGLRLANAGSRFSAGTATPRLPSLDGRYGEGSSGAMANASILSTLQSATTAQLAGGGLGLALPGAPSADDTLSQFTDRGINTTATSDLRNGGVPPTWWDGARNYNWITTGTVMMSGSAVQVTTRGGFNAPPDLHGRMITTTSTTSSNDVVPRLAYAKPEWGGTETQDDPYELRLDPRAPRNTQLLGIGTAIDGVFSAAELEPVLRPYDSDTFQLPQRLNALLGGVAEEARLRVTTDSWDTTAVTGTAAANIRTWLRSAANGGITPIFGSSSITGLIGGEVARGERFNLNRPFTADKPAAYSATHPYYVQRQAYFKDLYTLLIAVSGTASPPTAATRQKYAQWAANVVDFRDDDSTMTPFEYDGNPANGWSVDGDVTTSGGEADRAVVWGAERPEAIIAATSAWENHNTGEMFILLHRPWNALAFSRSGGSSEALPAEPIDVELDVMAGNTGKDLLNLSRKSGGRPFDPADTSTYPVWRLRLVSSGSTSYVRFDISTTGTTNELVASGLTSQYRMAADAWQCVMGANAAGMLVPGSSNPTFSSFMPPGDRPASGDDQPPSRQIDVFLERLTDPRATINATTWTSGPSNDDPATNGFVPMYRVVDKARMTVVNREIKPPATAPTHDYSVARRSAATLWPVTLTSGSSGSLSLRSSDFDRSNGGAATWFPWNNRPFVSSAELYLVPGSDPNGTGNSKDALGLLQQYVQPSPAAPLPVLATLSGSFFPSGFFDAVHVPSRFSGIHTTISPTGMAALSANAAIYSDTLSVNQLSSFREPGRVNLNTVTADDVWNAVVAGPLQTSGTAQPVKSRTAANFAATFAAGMQDVLALVGSSGTSTSGTVPFPVKDTFSLLTPLQSLNPAHNIYTATRLANTATVRSNVFGIWITVRESVAGDPDSIRLHRAFYIFDRSIPVAFDPGKDHNVWDAVLLRRVIQ